MPTSLKLLFVETCVHSRLTIKRGAGEGGKEDSEDNAHLKDCFFLHMIPW